MGDSGSHKSVILLTGIKGEVRKAFTEHRQLVPASLPIILFPGFNLFSVASPRSLKVRMEIRTGDVDAKITAN